MNPRWDAPPPSDSKLQHLPLQRLGAGLQLKAAITSPAILGVWTHFMGGRTLACLQEGCPGCENNLPRRWEGYLGVLTAKDRRHLILALTPGAAIGIGDTAPDPFNLRGLVLIAERIGKRANARLRARVEELDLSQIKLPPIPDLKAHMMHIWGLDQAHAGQDYTGYAEAIKKQYGGQTGSDDESPAERPPTSGF